MGGLTRRRLFGFGGGLGLGLAADVQGVPLALWPFGSSPLAPDDKILVNQVGYRKGGPKAILVANSNGVNFGTTRFQVHESQSHALIGRLEVKVEKTGSKEVGLADFSGFDREGHFYLRSGRVASSPFVIAGDPYGEAERLLARAFYFQRCGDVIFDPETGYGHDACHGNDAIPVSGGAARDCTGGWHDAGDFGKYVATTAVALGEILSLCDAHPQETKALKLGLPGVSGSEGDLLSEMRVGLSWLLKMQLPYGAFDRKVAGTTWPTMEAPPETDVQDRFSFGPSTGDTAKAGAALALAARVYRPYDAAFADRCLAAAARAHQHLSFQKTPLIRREAGDDTGSGAYFDVNKQDQAWDAGDRLWLAAELYLTTGDETFGEDFAHRFRAHFLWPTNWSDASAIGILNIISDKTRKGRQGARALAGERLLERADEFEKVARLTPWRTADEAFGWGSNRDLASRGRLLLAAYELDGNEKYYQAAVAQLDYLFGLNPHDLCFVTGLGAHSPENIHHRGLLAWKKQSPSAKLPGLLVGGANGEATDHELLEAKGVEKYRDAASSYETNEFSIDNNAALLALLGRLRALRPPKKSGFFGRILGR